jgi:DNA-directed RNA polymerase III subunit RPC1
VLVRPNVNTRVFVNLVVTEKNYNKKANIGSMCITDGYVCFRNSELISGQLGKATLGNGNKDGLFTVLLRDYGSEAAAVCMNRLAKLSARWIGNHGFSIGIDDVQPSERLSAEKEKQITKGYDACDQIIQLYNKGKLDLQPGCNAAETLESSITGELNKIREAAGNVCTGLLCLALCFCLCLFVCLNYQHLDLLVQGCFCSAFNLLYLNVSC